MTAPNHYSRDITIRCQSLIQHLMPKIEEGVPGHARFGGPLTTTFLLAMAAPMIVLPIERIFKPQRPDAWQVGDDRELDPAFAEQMDEVFGDEQIFADAPFAANSEWRYVNGFRRFNVGGEWPPDLVDYLDAQAAIDAAQNAPPKRIMFDLRNALAHGGVMYLDERGHMTEGEVATFAFVGAKLDRRRRLVGLNVLRVSENDFLAFLAEWTKWLEGTLVLEALTMRTPVEA